MQITRGQHIIAPFPHSSGSMRFEKCEVVEVGSHGILVRQRNEWGNTGTSRFIPNTPYWTDDSTCPYRPAKEFMGRLVCVTFPGDENPTYSPVSRVTDKSVEVMTPAGPKLVPAANVLALDAP